MLNVRWRKTRREDEIVFLCYDNKPFIIDHLATDEKRESTARVECLGKQADYGGSWTKGIIEYIRKNPCDYFMLMLEDHMIHQVDFDLVEKAESKLMMDRDVSKVELVSDWRNYGYQIYDDNFLVKHQNARYRTSVMPAIWRTEYFLKYAAMADSAWDFEIKAGERAKNDGALILACRRSAVDCQNLIKRGQLLERKAFERPMLMSIVCATRGRPEQFASTLKSIRDNTVGDWELFVGVDDNDETLARYDFNDDRITVIVFHGRKTLYDIVNRLIFASRGDLVQFIADDCLIETYGWDEMIRLAKPEDDVFVTACFDGKRITSFHQCTSRKVIDVIGYFFAPCLKSYYGDPWLDDIASYLARVLTLPELVINHKHDEFKDDTRSGMEANAARDKTVFRAYSYERMQAAYKLSVLMDGTHQA
jgi:hypothetical protein